MEIQNLAAMLNNMYFGSETGESVAMIHLFGIKYAKQIRSSGESTKAIAKAAGIPESYSTEISKGVKLSNFVTLK